MEKTVPSVIPPTLLTTTHLQDDTHQCAFDCAPKELEGKWDGELMVFPVFFNNCPMHGYSGDSNQGSIAKHLFIGYLYPPIQNQKKNIP